MQGDKFVKEDNEWPALSAAVSTDGRHLKNVQSKSNEINNHDGATGSDLSKENNNQSQSVNVNSGARKKKKPTKISWQPLQIETQPYRKRGSGRYINERYRSAESNKNARSSYDCSNHSESGIGNSRNGGFKNKRGRPYASNRSYVEDPTTLEDSLPCGIIINGVTFFPQTFSDATLKNLIKRQMEYYFSDKNLTSDVYLRLKMDNLGFVPLSIFLNFPRIMCLTRDVNILAEAVEESNKLELQCHSDLLYVRRVVDPLGWGIRNQFHNQIESLDDTCLVAPLDGINVYGEHVHDGYPVPLNEFEVTISSPNEESSNTAVLNEEDASNILPVESYPCNELIGESNLSDIVLNKDKSSNTILNGVNSYNTVLNKDDSNVSVEEQHFNESSNEDDKNLGDSSQNNDNSNDNLYPIPLNEDDSNVVPLVCQIQNLNLNTSEAYTIDPLHMEPSDEHYASSFCEQLSSTISPSTVSPPELDIELSGVFIESKAINDSCNYYLHPSSPLEQGNTCNLFPDNVYNDVIFYDSNELTNQGSVYYVVNSNKVLSTSSDNSNEEAMHLSPEPSR